MLGKSGRAETSTDPAPFSMMETIILLKPKSEWRKTATWYDQWPRWMRPLLTHITPDHISTEQLVDRDGRGAADSGRLERLDDADQEPHRHADHGRAHAGGHQDLRRRTWR